MRHPETISKILAAYDVAPTTISEAARGYRNHTYAVGTTDGRQLNLIQYKRDPDILERILRANAAGEWAHKAGLPTRHPVDPRILRATGRQTTHFSLYNYLPGDTIPWEAYTQAHLKLTGLALGRLHAELKHLDDPRLQAHAATNELLTLHAWMQHYFNQAQVADAILIKLRLKLSPSAFNSLSRALNYTSKLPSQQPLHLDFVRSNLLFAPAKITDPLQFDDLALTGIIDFEKTAWGHPVIDLARTLAFLLVDCHYKTTNQIRKYFLHSGYVKRGGGTRPDIINPDTSRLLLDELTDWFLLYDFAKFLRHNPYESLAQNLHFRRTIARLISRQIVLPSDNIKHKQDETE